MGAIVGKAAADSPTEGSPGSESENRFTDEATTKFAGWTNESLTRVIVWIGGLEIAIYLEGTRLRERLLHIATTGWWIGDPDPDGTFFLPLLLFAPFCFLFPLSLHDVVRALPVNWSTIGQQRWLTQVSMLLRQTGVMVVAVSLLSLGMSWVTSRYELPALPGKAFGELGPYVHDEFSYQLQAETYLAGRLSWPGVPRARELFHQMHVLNEDQFASRYFPATGAWLAPFVACGFPVGASWFAGMIVTGLAASITRRTHGLIAGWLAGLLVAVAPGGAIFNNLLLAHGPTLVGLLVCLFFFRRLFDQFTMPSALGAGTGLTLAMLSRPLTAASVALPFGLWWLANGLLRPSAEWWRGTLAMGTPLLVGFAILGWQNEAITGNVLQTPYSLYNTLYTPRHAFGFRESNSIEVPPARRYLRDYDQWARLITWDLATENLGIRLKESLAWSLGMIPLAMAGLLFILNWKQQPIFDWLLLSSIVSLHVAHFPYWLSGILGYHYVYESGVLLLMLFAGIVVRMAREAIRSERMLAVAWMAGMIALSVAINFGHIAPGSTVPRITTGIRSVTHVAERYERFRTTLSTANLPLPALVLVNPTAADLHVEYVHNRPPFDSPLLMGRYRPDVYSDAEVLRLFPERTVYLYECDQGTLRQLDPRLSERSSAPAVEP